MQNPYKIRFNAPFVVGKELYYVAKAVYNGRLSGNGQFTKQCHQWFEEQFNCAKALLTHSCTGALEMAAILCDIHPGDEVIMPSYTFVSTANAFVLRGAIPVFVDIQSKDFNINPDQIEAAISDKTKAIVPVHYAGQPCNMERIMDIAARHNLFVVEDAAQAMLSDYNGKKLGTIGHLGCLSFHETKNIICGQGGALLINDSEFVDRAVILWEKGTNRSQFFEGRVDKYTWVDIGSSFSPNELTAAYLYGQLEQAEQITARRTLIYSLYYNQLMPLQQKGYIRLADACPESLKNGHLFYFLARNPNERMEIIQFLADRGIHAVFHYAPLHSSAAGRRYGRVHGDMNITKDISARLVRLPLHHQIRESEVAEVVQAVTDFYTGR